VSGALTLVGSTRAGFDSSEKFLTAARAAPGKYQFGSADNTTRMIGELFRVKSGLSIENVAYKGAAPMLQELVGGHIPVGSSSPLSAMSHHRAGTLRMLAVTGEKRLALLPDVPTMVEAGVPGVDRPQWFSLFGPGNMPGALARLLKPFKGRIELSAQQLAEIAPLGVQRSMNGLLACATGGFASRSNRSATSLACSYRLNGPSRRIGPLASRSITP
jgi:hypothetical protein